LSLPDSGSDDSGEEKDWAAAKAFFDNLKTNKPRPPKPRFAVTIAVSSRTLFDMVAERKIYEEEGLEKYVAHQVEHESEPLAPGAAFPFVKALMNVNSRLRELYPDSEELFDIVLMTNNHAQVGVRLINSINHYDLTIERFCMTGGKSPIGYLKAYMTNLYLSKDSEKVIEQIPISASLICFFSSSLIFTHLHGDSLALFGKKSGPHTVQRDTRKTSLGVKYFLLVGTVSAHVPYGIGQKYHKGTLINQPAKKE
uniref:5'-nucleotidase, cytosolic IB b n=1 Tax=Scophthalmus maximus TaxID=52904 RepID=A0A8D2ZJ31_SCOMX